MNAGASPNFSPLALTLLLLKAASMQLSATLQRMIGGGMHMTQLRVLTGLEIRWASKEELSFALGQVDHDCGSLHQLAIS